MRHLSAAILIALVASGSPALAGTVCTHDPNYGMNQGPFGALARALDGGTRCVNVPDQESQFRVAPSALNPAPVFPQTYRVDPSSLIIGQCYDVNGVRMCRQY